MLTEPPGLKTANCDYYHLCISCIVFVLICTVVALYCSVMCGCVCMCVGFVMCGCVGVCVCVWGGVL